MPRPIVGETVSARELARLRRARESRKIAKADLAAQIGVSVSLLHAWEFGTRHPSAAHLETWRALLGGADA